MSPRPRRATRRAHEVAWPDMFANLQTAYAELTRTRQELERRAGEIEQTRNLFERVVESMTEALFLLDHSGRVVQGNAAAAVLLSRERADLIGQRFSDLSGTDEVPATPWQLAERCPDGAMRNLEVEFRVSSGKRVPVSTSCGLVRDHRGKVVGMLVVASDITERRRMEHERARLLDGERAARTQAEAARQRFALLAEVSNVLVASLDPYARLQDLADALVPQLADWCTVNVVEEAGRIQRAAVASNDPLHLEILQQVRDRYPFHRASAHPMMKVLQGGEPELVPEVTDDWLAARAEDGEHLRLLRALRITSYLCVPMPAHGRLLGTISLIMSESGRHYGVDDLALAQDVARRAALALDNARLFMQAQGAVRIRDEFLGTVSHDLKTPLTAISGYAQMLQRYLSQADTRRLLDGLQRIEHATMRMRGLLDELLDVARLQAGQSLGLDYRTADLIPMLNALAAEHQRTSDRHNIRVRAEAERLAGRWDTVRIERVLDNLLSNAIKYSPEGGEVEVHATNEEGWVVVRVRDQGIGIPDGDLSHIFERFHRGANVGDLVSGAGLGLAGARYIVQQHGGTIEVESQEGVGSTFTVRLPVQPPMVPE